MVADYRDAGGEFLCLIAETKHPLPIPVFDLLEDFMTPDSVMMIGQEAMLVAVKLTAPILLSSLAVGLVIAMFQAATQINEMTLTFVPKLVTIGAVLIVAGPWMITVLVDYIQELVRNIPSLIG